LNTDRSTQQDASERPRQALPKMPTGVAGLDDILRGGLPEARTTLFVGGPGSGKTVLSLETLCRAARADRPGVFVSFEERADAVRTNALSMGWDLAALERQGRLALLDPQLDYHAVRAGEFRIHGLLAVLDGQAEQIGARVVVIDAIDGLLRLFDDPGRRDDELYALHSWLLDHGFTAILTVKSRAARQTEPVYPLLDFLADCVIDLDQRTFEQVSTRRLRVMKYRGSGYISNECPFVISPDGVVLMPAASLELVHMPVGPPRSSGNETLDEMLGGGYRQGSTVLIAGPTGCGKTTLACTFALGAGARGERTLYISFEEGKESLLSTMRNRGLDLAPLVESGVLQILTAMPESMGVEEHLLRIVRAIERFRPEHLVVDAISAAKRMGADAAAFDFLIRLLGVCRERGIMCFYLNQMSQSAGAGDISGIGISSLIDTVLVLDYAWNDSKLERSLFVLKSRSARHSLKVHRLTISENGMVIHPPATDGGREDT
jgi:circadian clock protein KaiC